MGDRRSVNDAVAPERMRDGVDRRDVGTGDSRSLHLFCDRCTAACTGTSGRDHDRGIDLRVFQHFRDAPAERLPVYERRTRPDR